MKADLNDEDIRILTTIIDGTIESAISGAGDNSPKDSEQRRLELASLFRTREKIAPLANGTKKPEKKSGRGSSTKRGLPSAADDTEKAEA